MTPDALRQRPAFGVPPGEKEAWLLEELRSLTAWHASRCPGYRRLLEATGQEGRAAANLADLPYLPVGLFKSHELRSVEREEVFRVLTSSGTTGQAVSRISLDRETAALQVEALASIMKEVLGPARLPMLVVDSPAVIKERPLSARGAGVLGMINFGRAPRFVLDQDMRLDEAGLRAFLAEHGGRPFLIFGFTFMVWRYLHAQAAGRNLDLSGGVLVHSGGWKKLQELAVDNAEFRRRLREDLGVERVHNFYGMVEQVGSVFLEGADGFLHAPWFADVIVRDPVTWREAEPGQAGVIQVLSALPRSYPGHSILTEDLGTVMPEDGANGWRGKRITIHGRLPRAELRGCSDTHAFGRERP